MPESDKPELNLVKQPPEEPQPRQRRTRTFTVDKEEVTRWVLSTHREVLGLRDPLKNRRLERRAKLKGWMTAQDYPWEDASNCHLPVMEIANLKVKGTLENAFKSFRPMLEAKARQRINQAREASIDTLLDYQFFVENTGENLIDAFTTNFVEDEAVYALVQYIKEEAAYYDVRSFPGLGSGSGLDSTSQLMVYLDMMFNLSRGGGNAVATDKSGYEWDVTLESGEIIHVSFYDTEDGVDACMSREATSFDGPTIRILDFEDVVFPSRSANLQPPSSFNPQGAPWVDVRFSVNLDTIIARRQDGTYDQLTQEDIDEIAGLGSGLGSEDDEKEQKDALEGVDSFNRKREDRQGVMRFGRLDVNGDGLDEDVIIWVFEKPEKLAKIALLSEHYPGLPVRRPVCSTSYIAIPNRVIGTSNSELTETLQDLMKTALDQHINWGEITNTPMFFYRAASGMKAEQIFVKPAMGYPLDQPQTDVMFPQWPTKDSTYAINLVTLAQQFVEMIEMQSQASYGRVPTGKSAAYRTVGTTVSLLAQTDARAEQVLRRAFAFWADVYELMHRLNRRFLPDQKEVRVIGAKQEEEKYLPINRTDLEADVDWDFKASLLTANKETLAQALQEVMMLAITPLAFQAGMIDPQGMYELMFKFGKAKGIDLTGILKKPPDPMPGPKYLAEEVLTLVLNNQPLQGGPLENPQEHLQTLMMMASDAFSRGLLNQTQMAILKGWMQKIQAMMMMQQQFMMAAQQFQQGQQGGGGPGGAPTTLQTPGVGQNPPVQPGEKIDEGTAVQ